jgi:hypothetical protein
MPRSRIEVLRLTAVLACLALATSRVGLLAHELLGHGGTAVALGGHLTEVRLFWFAGGWVRYELPDSSLAQMLAIAMGGIAVELAVGTAIVLLARGDSLSRRLVRGIGAALVLHGSWYLATGAWSGYGDGQLLYTVLGDWRYAVAIAAGAITCSAAFVGARSVFGGLVGSLSEHRIAGVIGAVAIAAGLNLGLALGELHVRRDRAYTMMMQPQRERIVARELTAWTREQGSAIDDAQVAAQRAKLEDEHRTFPFAWLLAACTTFAGIAGAWRSRLGEPARLPLRASAIAAAISIGAVIALSYAL